jgi:hypothetical protein
MKVKAALELLRQIISDEQATGFTESSVLEWPEQTAELLNYLDRAVKTYSDGQAAKKDPRFLRSFEARDADPLPADWIAFAGNVPVRVVDGIIDLYGPIAAPIRYFARLPLPSALGLEGDLGGNLEDQRLYIGIAAAYALNKHEFDVSQDLMLLGQGA